MDESGEDWTVSSFHEALKDRINGATDTSWRKLSAITGLATSTVRGWLKKPTLISVEQLEQILAGLPDEPAEKDRWRQQHQKVAAGLSVDQEQRGSVNVRPTRNLRRWAERGALVLFGVVIGFGTAWMVLPDEGSPDSAQCGSVKNDTREYSVASKVAFTGGYGVKTYYGPGTSFCTKTALPEGEPIRVVCQKLDGEMFEDRRTDGHLERSPVWDKLDSGRWIPHVYTDLPPTAGKSTVSGLAVC